MNTIVACLLALAISMPLSDASCVFKPFKPGMSNGVVKKLPKAGESKVFPWAVYGYSNIPAIGGCELNGKLYPFGSIERTEDCYRCSCSEEGMSCCSLFHTPLAYDKKNCKVVFNKKRCDYDVVRKDDPSKECVVYSRVG